MQRKFSEITKKLQANLPTWSKIRVDPTTLGARFLNVFGLQYEDIEHYLQYALDNYHITTADVHQIDLVYKSVLPRSLNETMKIIVVGNDRPLTKMDGLKMFYEGIDNRFLESKQVYYPNPFFIDWDNHILYTRYSYGANEAYPEGKITLQVYREEEVIFEYDMRQQIHHVWNFFDEFGLLLDLPRIYGERNVAYKERLLNVFLHKPNSSRMGMANSLANELDMRRRIRREIDPNNPTYALEYTNVIPDSVYLSRTAKADAFISNEDDQEVSVQVASEHLDNNNVVQIDFISGMKLHEFHDKDDNVFQSMLYDIEGRATPVLKYYIEVIKQRVPTMWGEFIWNESFWDIANAEMSGYGVVPTFKDARFLTWANYKI